MASPAEVFSYLFPGNQLNEFPVIASPLSVVSLPVAAVQKEHMVFKFRASMIKSSSFLERIDFIYLDRLQMMLELEGLEPTRMKAGQLAGVLIKELAEGESLGGVASRLVDNLYVLLVIGILKDGDPKGLFLLKTGNAKLAALPGLAQTI